MVDSPQHRYEPLDPKKFKNKIWEAHPDETSRAYAYFCTYRDMGITRSLNKTAEIHGMDRSAIFYYSSPCNWVKRAKAYDVWLEVQLSEERLKALKEMTKRHINSLKASETALTISIRELLGRVNKGTAKLDKISTLALMQLVNSNANTIAKVVETERKVNELPSEIIKNEYGEGTPEIVVAMPLLTDKLKKKITEAYKDIEDGDAD